jgi:hypothetical protein
VGLVHTQNFWFFNTKNPQRLSGKNRMYRVQTSVLKGGADAALTIGDDRL